MIEQVLPSKKMNWFRFDSFLKQQGFFGQQHELKKTFSQSLRFFEAKVLPNCCQEWPRELLKEVDAKIAEKVKENAEYLQKDGLQVLKTGIKNQVIDEMGLKAEKYRLMSGKKIQDWIKNGI